VVATDVSGAVATTFRPDGADGSLPTVGVNVFLLQANPSGEMGNLDLPTRNASRELIGRPTVVYELIYLLTFHGSEARLEPQRVQASVLRYLHAEPCISKKFIRDQITAAVAAEPNHFLRNSNLADQASTIKITPFKLSLEDLSKVWSVFFQTNYILTSTFRATYVLLDTEDAGQASLPVRHRSPYALPFSDTVIESLAPDRLEYSATANFTLLGQSLTGPQKKYLVDDLEATLQAGSTATAAILRVPAASRAGVKKVRIVEQAPLGANHRGTESNVALLLLLPAVQTITYVPDPSVRKDHTVRVVPKMTVGLEQRVSLLLNRTTPPAAGKPWSYSLALRPRTAETDPLIFAAKDVVAGTYMYRLRVDELDSELTLDTTNPDPMQQPYNGPTVVVP
jgi:hypothetical protein